MTVEPARAVSSASSTDSPFELERRERMTLGGGSAGASVMRGRMQERLTHLDLFSGIGGFALAAKWAGIRTIGFSEIDPFASRVLAKNFPDTPNYGDIRKLTGVRADIITGGFPCQPFSCAGKRLGKEDDRHLWPEMCRVIADARPTWVVGENVPGIIGVALDDVLSDMAALGYACRTFVVPACAVDARHRRNRIWIVAHAEGLDGGLQLPAGHEEEGDESLGRGEASPLGHANGAGPLPGPQTGIHRGEEGAGPRDEKPQRRGGNVADAHSESMGRFAVAWQERSEWLAEPAVGRVANGIPGRVDRLRGLGNAIVPQVAFVFLDAIAALEFGGAVADARGGSAGERVSGNPELSRAQMERGTERIGGAGKTIASTRDMNATTIRSSNGLGDGDALRSQIVRLRQRLAAAKKRLKYHTRRGVGASRTRLDSGEAAGLARADVFWIGQKIKNLRTKSANSPSAEFCDRSGGLFDV